jgi:hypothetical protein
LLKEKEETKESGLKGKGKEIRKGRVKGRRERERRK